MSRKTARVLQALLIVVVVAVVIYHSRPRGGPGPAPNPALETYNGCGMEGDARSASVMELNRLKNRYTAPQPAEINTAITMAALVAPGDDTNRWRDDEAAEITGYVWDVKPGGIETVNCDAREIADRDTHIELAPNPERPEQKVIVEVTPRLRAIMAQQGVNWSTPALRDTLRGQWVRVRGWMLFDEQHKDESENTAPGRPRNWRWTAWEVHPITSIELVPRP